MLAYRRISILVFLCNGQLCRVLNHNTIVTIVHETMRVQGRVQALTVAQHCFETLRESRKRKRSTFIISTQLELYYCGRERICLLAVSVISYCKCVTLIMRRAGRDGAGK